MYVHACSETVVDHRYVFSKLNSSLVTTDIVEIESRMYMYMYATINLQFNVSNHRFCLSAEIPTNVY